MMFNAIARIDETAYVAAVFDKSRNIDSVILIEYDDDDNLMLTNANALDELHEYDIEFLRSFFTNEYAHEFS